MSTAELKVGDWFIDGAPKKFDQIFNQETIVKYFKEKQQSQNWDKSVFLQGLFGSGKTALAKIIAVSIACKNTDANGEPCLTCPTCEAVFEERFDRDVIYLNGTSMSAQEIENTLDQTFMTAAMRDRAKVIIMDETQALSPQAVNKFLIATQSPKRGMYFIFTSMDKLSGKNPGALQSRCKNFKIQVPDSSKVYDYLASICIERKLKGCPTDFLTKGLEFIASNCEFSFRNAIQMLQQCYEGKIFTIEEIRKTFNIISYDDAAKVLADVAHGRINKNVYSTIMGTDYQDKIPLLIKILGDAATYRVFGLQFVDENEHWLWKNAANISSGQYFDELTEAIKDLTKSAYVKRGDFQMAISNMLNRVKVVQPAIEVAETKKVSRRKAV